MSSETPSWLSLITRLPGWILGGIAFVSAVVGFIELIRRDLGLAGIILVVVGVCGGIVGCLYLAFKRAPSRLVTSIKGPWRYPRGRPWALAGLVAIPLLTLCGIAAHHIIDTRPPTKVIVLVADFDGADPKTYRVTKKIVDTLRRATETYPNIEVGYLKATITDQDGSELAQKKGKAKKATIVLWGSYGVTNECVDITANFEILRQPADFLRVRKERPLTLPAAALKHFTVQDQLSSEMSYLTLMTVGVARLQAWAYEDAISLFTAALSHPDKPDRPPAQVGSCSQERSGEMVHPADIYAYRGAAHLLKGDLDDALKDFDQAITTGSQAPHDRSGLIGPYINRGFANMCKLDFSTAITDLNEAIKIGEDVLKKSKRDTTTSRNLAAAYMGRGFAYTFQGHQGRALEDFAQAIARLTPDDAQGYLIRGQAFFGKEDYPRAIKDFTQALDRRSDFITAYLIREQASFGKPDLRTAYLFRALAYAKQGDHARALRDAEHAVQLLPDTPMAYFIRSHVYAEQSDWPRALEDINRAIARAPDFLAFYLGRATFHSQSNDHAQALTDVQRLIQLRPDFAEAYAARGNVHFMSRDEAWAMEDYTRAIQLGMESAMVYFYRGGLYVFRGDYRSAIADFTKGLQLRPAPQDIVRIYLGRAVASLMNKDFDQAIADFDRLLQFDAENVTAYIGRGRAYAGKGDLMNALADLEHTLQRDPHNAGAYCERGKVLEQLRKTGQAIPAIPLQGHGAESSLMSEVIALIQCNFPAADKLDFQALLKGATEGLTPEWQRQGGGIRVQDDHLVLTRNSQRKAIALSSIKTLPEFTRAFAETYQFLLQHPRPAGEATPWENLAIAGMLKTLDKDAKFIPPQQQPVTNQAEETQGTIGVRLALERGEAVILESFPGTPASRAGLNPGDRLLAINGDSINSLTTAEDAIRLLRGPTGSRIMLDALRQGSSTSSQVTVIRAPVGVPPNVETDRMDSHIGYIRVRSLTADTFQEIEKALGQLTQQPIAGLILDLRDNLGGLLSQAVKVSNLFIEEGRIVAETEGRAPDQNTRFMAHGGGQYRRYPLIALINSRTAGGAEIIAGALQDLGQATIMGARSYGRGSVRTEFPLQGGSTLRLTTAYVRTPSRKHIEGEGIRPDIEFQSGGEEDRQLRTAHAILQEVLSHGIVPITVDVIKKTASSMGVQ